MSRTRSITLVGLMAALAAAPASAQTGAAMRTAADPAEQTRYQIQQMERALEGAVEHGATVIRKKVQSAINAQNWVQENAENAHVRGFRLEGYGAFFDVEVPPMQGSFMLTLQTLDQNGLGLRSALQSLRAFVDKAGTADLQQALRRVELQVGPGSSLSGTVFAQPATPDARKLTGASAATVDDAPDPILSDPQEAYRREITRQIQEAMLDYTGPLGLSANEWLTVAARRHDDRPLLAPADSDARTVIIYLKGSDLAAFRANQITRDEALSRMATRVF